MLLLLATLAAVYVVAYGWLLVSLDFVPYVTDNNESCSAFAHAANMLVFGIANSAAPFTSTTIGREYFSDPIELGQPGAAACNGVDSVG